MATNTIAIPDIVTNDPAINEAFFIYKQVIYELAEELAKAKERINNLENP